VVVRPEFASTVEAWAAVVELPPKRMPSNEAVLVAAKAVLVTALLAPSEASREVADAVRESAP